MRKRKKILVIATLCAACVLILAVLELTNTTHLLHKSPQQQAKEQTARLEAQKKKDLVESSAKSGSPTPQATYVPPTDSHGITLSAKQPQDAQVVVTSELTGYSDGLCTLDITNGNATLSQSAPVIYQQQFSTCAGFTIPKASLGPGTWQIKLSITSGGATTSKMTTFEVR